MSNPSFLKTLGLFIGAPFLGLAFAVFLPFIGIATDVGVGFIW